MRLSDEDVINLTLIEIERLLQKNRGSLTDYPGLPYPKGYVLDNKIIYDERDYDTREKLEEFNKLYQNLTGNIGLPLQILTIIYVFGMARCINSNYAML